MWDQNKTQFVNWHFNEAIKVNIYYDIAKVLKKLLSNGLNQEKTRDFVGP